jgi:cytochrome b subunit of formate dehydrogenase
MPSIEYRPDRPKPYRARYWGPDGKLHSRSFARKDDAQRWLTSEEAAKLKGSWIDPSRRPAHPVGWLLLIVGVSLVAGGVAPAYAAYGLLARPGALPAASKVFRYWPATVVIAQTASSFVLLLTPTGSLPSPRWRWWARLTVAAAIVLLVGLGVASGPLDPQSQLVGGPFDLRGQGGVLLVVNQLALAFTTVAVVVGAGSLVVRFRRARGVERQQLRWVASAAALAVLGAVVALGGMAVGATALVTWAISACFAMLPLAIGAAILRYRLYDLDRIISRTLAYGLLTVLLGGGYAVVVLGLGELLGRDSSLVVAAATLAVAAAFQPARARVQAAVDRRFNRRRYDAARTIEAFTARLRDEVDLDTLSAELLAVVDQTMQPTKASLWLRSPTRATQDHSDAAMHRPT